MLNDLSTDEYAQLVASVGTHRGQRHLLPYQCAALFQKALDGDTIAKVAEATMLSASQISKFTNLNDLSSEIRKLVRFGSQKNGAVSFSTASEISSLESNEKRSELFKATLEHSLSKSDVIAIRQRITRSNVSISEAIKEVLLMRPIVERSHMFVASLRKYDHLNESEIRTKVRKGLAELVGANNVITVSVGEGKLAFLLKDQAVLNDRIANSLKSENLQKLVSGLISETEID